MKLYDKFDDALMYCTNKGVKTWNWATGRTKADLANKMLCVAPVLEGSGFIHEAPFLGSAMALMYLGASHLLQKENTKQEQEEQSLANKGLKINPNNKYELDHKIIGPMCLTGSGLMFGYGSIDNTFGGDMIGGGLVGTGQLVRSASHYVMRADHLPPRKSVFKRVKDKLVDKIKDINWNPLPQPERVPVPVEDYLVEGGVN